MNLLLLISASITVSIDSFICGLSLQAEYLGNKKIVLGITFSVFLICFLGSVFGESLGVFLSEYADLLGGIILYLIAVINLKSVTAEKEFLKNLTACSNKNVFKKSLAVGFGVGLDGAVACLSLTTLGYNSILITLLITLTHLLAISLAVNVVSEKTALKLKKYYFLPPFVLATLGAYKTACFFK